MDTKKEVVLAIEWAATEYKYLQALQSELQKIEREDTERDFKKAIKILHYLGRAEKRANRLEKSVGKNLEVLEELLSKHLNKAVDFKAIIDVIEEIRASLYLDTDFLLKSLDYYNGQLIKGVKRAAIENKHPHFLKEHFFASFADVHQRTLELIKQIETDVSEVERWVLALEASLQKAKKVLDRFSEGEQSIIEEEIDTILQGTNCNYAIFKKNWPRSARIISQDLSGLRELEEGSNLRAMLKRGIFNKVEEVITKENWPSIAGLSYEDILALRKSPAQYEISLKEILFVIKNIRGKLHYFPADEAVLLLRFAKMLIDLCYKEKISIIFFIDRSARVLGFLTFKVFSLLKIKNIGIQFVHSTRRGRVTFYIPKKKEMLKNKNVIVVDEYVSSGRTIHAVANTLENLRTQAVIKIAFSLESYVHSPHLFHVSRSIPTWYSKKAYSGLIDSSEKVEIDREVSGTLSLIREELTEISLLYPKYVKESPLRDERRK